MALASLRLALVACVFTVSALAGTISVTHQAGPINDIDIGPGVGVIFDFGTSFSSIDSITFIFAPCVAPTQCADTIDSGEQVLLALGHLGTFYFPNVGPGATINSPVPLTPGVLADFSDGYVKTSLWMDTLPGFNFNAYVGFADVTLQVNGTEVPEPASWLLALVGFGLFSHPRRRSSEVRG